MADSPTHRCIRDCYFRGRKYSEGELVSFPKGVKPNKHFEPLKKPGRPPKSDSTATEDNPNTTDPSVNS